MLHLYDHCSISFVQKVEPYEGRAEPALQGDDAAHHFFVECVLKQLPLLFLKENLSR